MKARQRILPALCGAKTEKHGTCLFVRVPSSHHHHHHHAGVAKSSMRSVRFRGGNQREEKEDSTSSVVGWEPSVL